MRGAIDQYKIHPVTINAAVDDRSGGNAVMICRGALITIGSTMLPPGRTGGGIEIDRIRIQPIAQVPDGAFVRFFLESGVGGPRFMIHEEQLPAGSVPTSGLTADDVDLPGPVDLSGSALCGPIYLKPNDALWVSCTVATPINIIAYGGDYGVEDPYLLNGTTS